jgi:uncharacterized protein YdaU (DUF1376 family)
MAGEKKIRDFEPLPYYRWYWRTFRSDRRVQRMNYVARGLLRELLDEQWEKGFIPDDPDACADICGCPSKVMRTHWNSLQQMFESVEQGALLNRRLEKERTESDKTRAGKSLAGIKSGEARRRQRTSANTHEQTLTDENTLLSSSSSSKQSKSSSECSDESGDSRPPVAALGLEGPRAPGDSSRRDGWAVVRAAMRDGGATTPIGFRRDDES